MLKLNKVLFLKLYVTTQQEKEEKELGIKIALFFKYNIYPIQLTSFNEIRTENTIITIN